MRAYMSICWSQRNELQRIADCRLRLAEQAESRIWCPMVIYPPHRGSSNRAARGEIKVGRKGIGFVHERVMGCPRLGEDDPRVKLYSGSVGSTTERHKSDTSVRVANYPDFSTITDKCQIGF